MDSPKPIPVPTSLEVKKGSKILPTSSAGIPIPLSLIMTSALPFSSDADTEMIPARSGCLAFRSQMASMLFCRKLINTWTSWLELPLI